MATSAAATRTRASIGTTEDTLVGAVFDALVRGDLKREDLSARRLTAFLGQSTIVLYHRFGSLEGFLIRVDGAGWRFLFGELQRAAGEAAGLEALMLAYVEFAFRYPALYWLMAERPFDRARLRAEGRLRSEGALQSAFGALLAAHGARDPERDTVVVFAALHGLASLASSGRLDLGGARPSQAHIREGARRIAALVTIA